MFVEDGIWDRVGTIRIRRESCKEQPLNSPEFSFSPQRPKPNSKLAPKLLIQMTKV